MQITAQWFDGDFVVGVIRSGGELGSFGVRFADDVVCHNRAVTFSYQFVHVCQRLLAVMVVSCMQMVGLGCHQGGVGLLREDSALTVHNPRLAEEGTWEEFEVEAHFPDEFLGNGAVQVYGHFDVLTFAFHFYRIYKVEVRVNHRIESGEVAWRVGIAERGGDAVVAELPVELFRHRLPLSGGGFQSDVSIRCHAVSVHDDTYSSLVSFGIDVIKNHDVDSLVLEITGGCQLEVLRMQRTAAAKQC